MIISKIVIENFLCYFGKKTFHLSSGLNIILGENGEGKTKFYEALDWMFIGSVDVDGQRLYELISAKQKKETKIGHSFDVSVAIEVKQFDEIKNIKKSFSVKKESETKFIASPIIINSTIERANGTHENVQGNILDSIFPFQYRKFSMFKGEQEFKVLEREGAFNILVDTFSESKIYDKLAQTIAELKKIREKKISQEGRRTQREILEHTKIKNIIEEKEKEKKSLSERLDVVIENKNSLEEHIQKHESSVTNSEEIEKLNKVIKELNKVIEEKRNLINHDYTKSLFDEKWILRDFKVILDECSSKIEKFSIKRRELQDEYQRQKGYKEAHDDIKMGKSGTLPFDVPSVDIMKEMLTDEICKICNRPAHKGSDAFKFMEKRLEEYEKIVKGGARKKKEILLFPNEYLAKLKPIIDTHLYNHLKPEEITESINHRKEDNFKLIEEINELNKKLEIEEEKKAKIISLSNQSEEASQNNLMDYRKWVEDLQDCKRDIENFAKKLNQLESDIKGLYEEAKQYNTTKDPVNITARDLYETLSKIMFDTKERKFNEFISQLQSESNLIFKKINIDAFKGYINFEKIQSGTNIKIHVSLNEENGKFSNPNDSLKTAMHISILFAISKLAKDFSSDDYPMIFDAPTSTFGEFKTTNFLNILNEVGNQKILLIKDFITRDAATGALKIKDEFRKINRDKAFWVKLQRPFNENDLSTINTVVEEL